MEGNHRNEEKIGGEGMFYKFKNRYLITGEVVATTAIHIGAAQNEFIPNGNKNPFFRNAEDLPIIPGSSLKGMMRSFMEQILTSDCGAEIFCGGNTCSEEEPCVNNKSGEYKKLLESKEADAERKLSHYLYGGEGTDGKLCTVCRLFGSTNNSAKLFVRDAKVIESTFQSDFEIRSGVSIDRDLGKSKNNQLYNLEVVPEGTSFEFYAILENADEREWVSVKKLLQAMKLGMISIGGMKSRGLGGMELQKIKYQKIDALNIGDLLSGKMKETKKIELE